MFWSMSSFANLTREPCSSSSWRRIGSTAWHGPHQGAQKSTITGVSAWMTSCSKLASVSSSMRPCYRRPRRARSRSIGTLQIASRTIPRLIFEPPRSRSTNAIGISTTRNPARRAR